MKIPRPSFAPVARLVALAAGTVLPGPPASAQDLWKDFAHPSTPHVELTSPSVPIVFDDLFDDESSVLQLPTLVVLMNYSDVQEAPVHTVAFFEDMVFGTGSTGAWTAFRPSVRQILEGGSNGRLLLTPATATETHGSADGIVGWVTAQCPPGVPGTCDSSYYAADIQAKRAEGVRRAAPFIDYTFYDDGDGVLESHELLVLVVTADDECCDQHDVLGHPDPPGCVNCPGGNTRQTNPAQVPVDGIVVHQWVAGLGEGTHANVFAHEIGHAGLGLGDLYNATPGFNPWIKAEDGYIGYEWQDCGTGCSKAYNDDCSNAVPLTDGLPAFGSTKDATGTDVTDCTTNDWNDVWFTYTPQTTGWVTFSTCANGLTSCVLDSSLAVFDGCGGSQLTGACNDDFDCPGTGNCDYLSQLDVYLAGGTTYWVRVAGYQGAEGAFVLTVDGGGGAPTYPDERWRPNGPGIYSLMASYPDAFLVHLDPWAKLHLGFLKPRVVTHDGTYTVHRAEPVRTFAQQAASPEALVIYDPLRADAEDEFMLLENRHVARVDNGAVVDSGLALWSMNEIPLPGESKPALRRVVRLKRRAGEWTSDTAALWDGTVPAEGYDVTASSTPQDTDWKLYGDSHVEITGIPAAGDSMTFFVRMTPLFVDAASPFPFWFGTELAPWPSLDFAVAYVAGQDLDGDGHQDGPRTVRLVAGSYPAPIVVSAPVTLTAAGGSVVLGD